MTATTATRAFTVAALLGALPASAMAHEGHHETMGAAEGLRHLLTQPDHLAILTIAAVVLAAGGWRIYRRRASR